MLLHHVALRSLPSEFLFPEAGLHKDRGQLDKAKLMYEKAVAGLRAAQGDKHLDARSEKTGGSARARWSNVQRLSSKDTLTCINNLGGVLRSLGEARSATLTNMLSNQYRQSGNWC